MVQETGVTRNHLLRNHYPENGVIIRRAELELRTAGTGGDFCPAQTLRADKTLFSRVAGMPNQKEFGQTRQDWRSASPVYSRKTGSHRAGFR